MADVVGRGLCCVDHDGDRGEWVDEQLTEEAEMCNIGQQGNEEDESKRRWC